MSGMVCDLKEELVLNMIRALLDTKRWESFKLVMAHNENIKTFEIISKHPEIRLGNWVIRFGFGSG